jgi:flavin-binding protein dodecin
MDEHVYKTTELTGSSRNSMEDAIQNAINKASETVSTYAVVSGCRDPWLY